MFEDKILGHNVKKSEKTASFKLVNGMIVRTEPEFTLTSPEPTDATREPMYETHPGFGKGAVPSAADGHGDPMNAVPKPYDLHGAGNATPHLLNLEASEGSEGNDPAEYKPSTPGRNPADGPAAVRSGDGYVVAKSSEFEAI